MIRRLTDILFASFCLILTFPLILIICISIWIDSKGPIFYRPLMVGHHGQYFRLIRFRTMQKAEPPYPGQDKVLTRVGGFIRNYSLDHLPMLINLLVGDITIIGPRPMEIDSVDLNEAKWQQYFMIKPGLINYAVLTLGKTWNENRVRNPENNQDLEIQYSHNQTLKTNFSLLIKSVHAWIKSKGNVKARGEPDESIKRD